MRVLITGGAGSLGQALVKHCLSLPSVERVVVYSRDEWKHAQLAAQYTDPRLRCFLGDVRDSRRLTQALYDIDTVIHAAALKRVDAVAYNPDEVVKTNVLGTMNVIHAAVQADTEKVLVISSDKAVNPTNIYGASKMMTEWLAVAANSYAYPQGTAVSCVRYGNVLGSRGSVLDLWKQAIAAGQSLTVTSDVATRFWMTMDTAVAFVWRALAMMEGGEIFIPPMSAAPVIDLATAFSWVTTSAAHGTYWWGHSVPTIAVTKLRPGGEKLHESLINAEESTRTIYAGWAYIIAPSLMPWRDEAMFIGTRVSPGWEYRSDTAPRLTTLELQTMLT